MNYKFLIVCYLVGMFIDWIFQWQVQAENKSNWHKNCNWKTSWIALSTHSVTYASATTLITMLILGIDLDSYIALTVLYMLFISHLIIDSRIPVKWIMRFKGMTSEQIADTQNYGWMHIGIDHRLHEMVILLLAFIV